MVSAAGAFTHYEMASPSLLASQPAIAPPAMSGSVMPGWIEFRSYLEARLVSMRNWRTSWWEHWALLAEYILPRRYHWLIVPNTMNRGLPINQNIVDPTATQAMRICASGLMSGLTSPSRPWFKLTPAIPLFELDDDGRNWLDDVEARVYRVLAGSNFYDSMAQMYEDLVVFGTSPVLIYEDPKEIIRCYNPCAGEYFLGVGSSLRVDTFNRQFVFTITQIVDMFGLENCPPSVQQMWASKGANLQTEYIVAHSIEPNWPIKGRGRGNSEVNILKGDFAYREVYWVWGQTGTRPLSVRGFKEFPGAVPRWATTSNDPYGRSPGMDALPDVMQLQVETKRKAEAIEKQVRPPLLASMDLKNEPSSILPGHITYASAIGPDKGMRPVYTVMPDLQYMTVDLKEIQGRIQKGLFNDLFLMIADSPAKDRTTAYEIAQKNQERLQVLGPVIERMQNEAFSPFLRRIIAVMNRRGLIPPAPKSMANTPISVSYISMIALAQQATATAGMERLLQITQGIGGADPSIFDKVDFDEFLNEYADLILVPHKIMRAKDAVEQIRAQRAQEMQKQQQTQAAGQVAGLANSASDTAKNLSGIDLGGGISALNLLSGNTNPTGAMPRGGALQ